MWKWQILELGRHVENSQIKKRNVCVCLLLSRVRLCNPMDYSLQAPLSMGFSRQEYWSGLPFPSLEDLSNSGIKPVPPELAGKFFTTESLYINNKTIRETKLYGLTCKTSQFFLINFKRYCPLLCF